MAEQLGRVTRIICDAPADDPEIMSMDCAVKQGNEFTDIGNVTRVFASQVQDEYDVDDIRYAELETTDGGQTLRSEIDLQGTQTCEIRERNGGFEQELVCDEEL